MAREKKGSPANRTPDPSRLDSSFPDANENPYINPDGIYSGMTKRLMNTDGSFAEWTTRAGDTSLRGSRETGKLKEESDEGYVNSRRK